MFKHPVIFFILFLAALGLGTVWVIEQETGTRILPKQTLVSGYSARHFYVTSKIKLRYWWHRIAGKADRIVAIEHDTGRQDKNAPELVKWQDENGTWHYEYKKPPPAPDPQ